MSYDLPDTETYVFTDATFGATTVSHNIEGPKGKVGFVRDIEVDVTTALVGTTSVPEINIGTASTDSTYGRYRLGTNVSTGYGTGVHRASQEAIVGNPPRTLSDFTSHVVLDGGPLGTSGSVGGGTWSTVNPAGRIPANTAAVITCRAGTGAAAGGGTVRVKIQWVGHNNP
jgi:hypothetical protein